MELTRNAYAHDSTFVKCRGCSFALFRHHASLLFDEEKMLNVHVSHEEITATFERSVKDINNQTKYDA